MSYEFTKESPYSLKRSQGAWFIVRDDEFLFPITPIKMPNWYGRKTIQDTPMNDVFLFEGYHYFHIAYEGCDLFLMGKQCKFCSTGGKWHRLDSNDIGEVVATAFAENPDGHVCLGGGTRWTKDKNAKQFSKYIAEIRKRSPTIPIWIEMVPPDDNTYIEQLIDAGATSFQFNLEIWDDQIRSYVCPGKFIVTKDRYFQAWEYVNKCLGPNKSGGVLIVDLEPIESTLEGIEALAKAGVKPGVIPFRPWDAAIFRDHKPASPTNFIRASKHAALLMKEYKLDPQYNQGCSNCRSCTVEDDFFEFIY
jgi:hypothetical protein